MRASTVRQKDDSTPSPARPGPPKRPFPVQAKVKEASPQEKNPSEAAAPASDRGSNGAASLANVPMFPEQSGASSGGGRPLPSPLRKKMEAAFRTDFSDVRTHQGPNAESLGALAFTQGRDIHFARGKYNPASAEGQKIIGHELTHVVQQRAGKVAVPQGQGAPINAEPKLETEADVLGARAVAGGAVKVSRTHSGSKLWAGQRSMAPIQPARGRVAAPPRRLPTIMEEAEVALPAPAAPSAVDKARAARKAQHARMRGRRKESEAAAATASAAATLQHAGIMAPPAAAPAAAPATATVPLRPGGPSARTPREHAEVKAGHEPQEWWRGG